nr:Activating signal cointegrator 1 complex subunit [Hymenolepis microstoma]
MRSIILDSAENILSPPLVKMGNKLYRKNPSKSLNAPLVPVGHLVEDFDPNEQTAEDDLDNDKTCHFVGNIQATSGGYVANLYVPPIFYSFIIGAKHSKRLELEAQFSCKLNVPGFQSAQEHIEITAQSENDVRGVARRIAWIVSEARPKMKPTHFVCLPVVSDLIKKNYLTLKNEVLEFAESDRTGTFRGIEPDLFVSEHKLHITLATLFLADHREVRLASQLLSTFLDRTVEGRAFGRSPLHLTIRGFDVMNDDPRSVQVLYMCLHEGIQSRRLQVLANGLADMFSHNGLHSGYRRVGEPVKLHLTILNSRLRSQRQARRLTTSISPTDSFKSESFCGLGILQTFMTRALVENDLFERVQLCKMVTDEGAEDDGTNFYPCIAELTWSNT